MFVQTFPISPESRGSDENTHTNLLPNYTRFLQTERNNEAWKIRSRKKNLATIPRPVFMHCKSPRKDARRMLNQHGLQYIPPKQLKILEDISVRIKLRARRAVAIFHEVRALGRRNGRGGMRSGSKGAGEKRYGRREGGRPGGMRYKRGGRERMVDGGERVPYVRAKGGEGRGEGAALVYLS